ncbi:hypothetical protein Zmor_027795 [Zophobas morio]|uniref:Uncharacterized protein n=1 Tax=Zophobas morio TaxID=2755281 RepID=A0AA38HNX2_9CUCU|nr:hypothetical protein Zmor_027795 [Zophobas morio]
MWAHRIASDRSYVTLFIFTSHRCHSDFRMDGTDEFFSAFIRDDGNGWVWVGLSRRIWMGEEIATKGRRRRKILKVGDVRGLFGYGGGGRRGSGDCIWCNGERKGKVVANCGIV